MDSSNDLGITQRILNKMDILVEAMHSNESYREGVAQICTEDVAIEIVEEELKKLVRNVINEAFSEIFKDNMLLSSEIQGFVKEIVDEHLRNNGILKMREDISVNQYCIDELHEYLRSLICKNEARNTNTFKYLKEEHDKLKEHVGHNSKIITSIETTLSNMKNEVIRNQKKILILEKELREFKNDVIKETKKVREDYALKNSVNAEDFERMKKITEDSIKNSEDKLSNCIERLKIKVDKLDAVCNNNFTNLHSDLQNTKDITVATYYQAKRLTKVVKNIKNMSMKNEQSWQKKQASANVLRKNVSNLIKLIKRLTFPNI